MCTTPESALQRCLDAFNQANAREDARSDFSPEALARVNRAWRRAMPILSPDTIDAFIACVTHGLLYEVFPLAETSKLLYAAQVTLGLLRARREAARQQSKSEPKTQPQQADTPSPLEGGEAELAAPQVPPSPLPPSRMAPKAQLAAPQVPQSAAPQVPQAPRKQTIKDREQVEAFLAQAFATPPPTPSPLPLAAKPQLAAPQAPQAAAR
jgi:hypothetical protein